MKKIIVLTVLCLSLSLISFSQHVKCDELISYVEKEGQLKGTVSPIQLIESSWLSEVKAYDIENTIVVIASIKQDDFGITTKKYIFCGISEVDWNYFSYPLSDLNKTFGERFRKNIFNKKCNCQ